MATPFKMKYQGEKKSSFPFKKFDRFKTFKESSELESSEEVFEKSLDKTEKIKNRADGKIDSTNQK